MDLSFAIPMMLVAASLEITPTFNAGVRIECGPDRVFLDTFYVRLEGYQAPPEAELAKMRAARAPYAGPLVIMATHMHADHYDADLIASALEHNAQARLVGTPEIAGKLRDRFPKQVTVLERGGKWNQGGVELELLDLRHSGTRWARLENSGHWIKLCGQILFHPGDADLERGQFERAFAGRPQLDVALVPYWYLTSDQGRAIVDGVLKPRRHFALHGDLRNTTKWIAEVKTAYPQAVIPAFFTSGRATR